MRLLFSVLSASSSAMLRIVVLGDSDVGAVFWLIDSEVPVI